MVWRSILCDLFGQLRASFASGTKHCVQVDTSVSQFLPGASHGQSYRVLACLLRQGGSQHSVIYKVKPAIAQTFRVFPKNGCDAVPASAA